VGVRVRGALGGVRSPGADLKRRSLRRPTVSQSNSNGPTTGPYDPQVVRQWLLDNGHNVAAKGRILEEMVAAWRAATQS